MKALLARLGFSGKAGVSPDLIGVKGRVSPLMGERRRFEEEMRGQFLKLKEKGLGIRVITL